MNPQRVWLTPLDLFLLIGANAIWGVNLVAAKLGIREFPPIFFAATRFAIVGLVLLPILRFYREQMRTLLIAAVFSGTLGFALMYLGFKLTDDISSMAIATQLGIPFSSLLSMWLLGERIRWRRKLGIVMSFAGVVIVSFDPRAMEHVFGLSLVVGSQIAVALGTIYIKRLRGINAWQLQAWLGVVSAPTLLLISFVVESGQHRAIATASWVGWASLAFTALASSLVAHTMMFHLIAKYPVTSVAPINVLSPLFSILCGMVWFGDQLTPRIALGGAITLAGVVIVATRDRKIIDIGN